MSSAFTISAFHILMLNEVNGNLVKNHTTNELDIERGCTSSAMSDNIASFSVSDKFRPFTFMLVCYCKRELILCEVNNNKMIPTVCFGIYKSKLVFHDYVR